MSIIRKIPPVKTFDLPAGNYSSALSQVRPMTKQSKRGPQDWIRLVFEVKVDSMANQIACAGRNFLLDLNPGSELRNFLEVWLGDEFFKAKSNQDLDFDSLIGMEGDITLSHFLGNDFYKPLVIVDNVFPAGSLRLAQDKPMTVAPVFKQ